MPFRAALRSVIVLASLCAVSDARAQGLIWSLPTDGAWVRYEGKYHQTEVRPESAEGNLELEWIQHLTIKSVGTETAEFQGKQVPCRWIELKSVTGKPSETGINPGPVGARILKVLVPEEAVTGQLVDKDNLPVVFLPVVKGYRKIGDGDVQPMDAKILQVYPFISLVQHYSELKPAAEGTEDPGITLGAVTAKKLTGTQRLESPSNRTTSEAALWRSDDVPFGLAKWEVSMVRELKDPTEPRNDFQIVSQVKLEMSAHAQGADAQSEIATPEAGAQ